MKLHHFLAGALPAALMFGTQPTHSEFLRFCVEGKDEFTECRRFRTIPPLSSNCDSDDTECVRLDCVKSQDCDESLRTDEADIFMASPLGLYYMNQADPGAFQPVVREHRGGDLSFSKNEDPSQAGLGYKVLAIVKKETCQDQTSFTLQSTKGYVSCHGKYGSMAGWVTPVIELQNDQLSSGDKDTEIIQNFYSSSCAPANQGNKLCTACAQDSEQCTLDDDYAGAVGTLRCVRAGTPDAPRVGFVDHLTALGAGQNDSFVPEDGKLIEDFQDSDASQQNIEDFQAICGSGACRGLAQAATTEDCYLEEVRADVAIMRSSDPRVQLVRREFVTASRTKAFRDLFGTTGNVRGALFSHGTHELRAEQADAESYIGDKLSTALSQYDSLFTLTPQTDAPTGSEGDSHVTMFSLSDEIVSLLHRCWCWKDSARIGKAVGVTLAVVLLVGLLSGACCFWCARRRRMRKGAEYGTSAEDPYMQKVPGIDTAQAGASGAPQAGMVMEEA